MWRRGTSRYGAGKPGAPHAPQTSYSVAAPWCLHSLDGKSRPGRAQPFKIISSLVHRIFLPRHPQELVASEDFRPILSIIGITTEEYCWIIPSVGPTPKPPGAREPIGRGGRWGVSWLQAHPTSSPILPHYPEREQFRHPGRLDRDREGCFAGNIGSDGSWAPVYFCEFQHQPSFFKDIKLSYLRSDHGEEVPFVFGASIWGSHSESSGAGSLRGSSFPGWGTRCWLGP